MDIRPTITYRSITMNALFAMFKQIFTTISMYFIAFEKIASASNNIATWADESTAAFADEARIERQKKLAKLKQELKAVEKQAA